MPAERIALTEGAAAVVVGVDFVGGDDEHRFQPVTGQRGIEEMRGSHDIGFKGQRRLAIGAAHQRLRCKMEHDLRLRCGGNARHRRAIADIRDVVRYAARNLREVEKAWIGLRCERKPVDIRAHFGEPERGPASLEAGMPGQQNALSSPETGVRQPADAHFQIFHGALPLAQRPSRCVRSRSVSIACQKPRWK